MENVPSIVARGIYSYERAAGIRPRPTSIADGRVNALREDLLLEGRPLHSFVPLYWATHTPMQYVNTQKRLILPPDELIFIEVSNEVLDLDDTWMSDGNATSEATGFYPQRTGAEAVIWEIVDTRDCYSQEYKWRKAAEVLVPDRVPPRYFSRICVRTPRARTQLRKRIDRHIPARTRKPGVPPIAVDPNLYY